jgi:hypothetical protein
MTLFRWLLLGLLCPVLFGCASITGDSSQPIRVDTVTQDGQPVTGADCRLANDFSTTNGKSGGSIVVHRSSKDLDINCTLAGNSDASARAISRANAGMVGNVIFGGAVGAIIDHNKGTAYTYPTWIRLVFGQTRVYDRMDEKEGSVQLGKLPAGTGKTMVAGTDGIARAAVVPVPIAATLATGYAPVDDVDAIPYLTVRGREAYREWLTKKMPRAFAVGADGSFGRGWGYGPVVDRPELSADPSQRALQVCEAKTRTPCRLYAINGAVVWSKEAVLAEQTVKAPPAGSANAAVDKPSSSALIPASP